ncbi:MAG: glycosyltransferase involved in cell wall biosynthesis [Planctomycetota bacterium]|jgi:glycosyltransferase involved in cell wall biosynthesis
MGTDDASGPLLSVVMPVFNEEKTLNEILDRVMAVPIDKEIIMVDDGSSDRSIEIAESRVNEHIRLVRHGKNKGKAGALATGFKEALGRIVIIQDADLEYDPAEYPQVIQPILDGDADVVFGSRFQSHEQKGHLFFHYIANRLLTMLSNICTNLNLTDMECCYKAFRREVIQSITIDAGRFAVEPELTQKVAKMDLKIAEVPVSYRGRGYSDGKKIGFSDAIEAVIAIFRFKMFWYPRKDFVLGPWQPPKA